MTGKHASRFVLLLLLIGVVALLVAGCATATPQATPTAPTTSQPAAVDTVAATSTAVAPTPAPATPSPVPQPTMAQQAGKGNFVLAEEQDSNIPGVPAGITEEGSPYRGDPNAPVVMEEYSDFQCPFCGRHAQQTEPTLDKDYIASGKLRHVFKNFPLRSIHPQADGAAEAALCAGVQGKFWPMHDLLFQRQQEWSGKENAAEVFRSFAQELGLDMEQYDACWEAQPFKEQIDRELAEGQERGVRGTPAFFINGWFVSGAQPLSTFQDVIAKASKGERPTPTPTPSYADEHPFEANPDTPGRTYLGDAYIGSPDAPIVILEVSDLLCPYCRRHHTEVWPKFKAEYVDTGQVRVVFKHLLGHGEKSQIAAEAAECVGNQGKFFDYIGLLYEKADDWSGKSGKDLSAALKGYAQDVGVDMDAFNECFDNHKMAAKVQADNRMMLQANVRGTPTFIVIVGDQALGRVPGFLTWEQWQQVMPQVLQAAGIEK